MFIDKDIKEFYEKSLNILGGLEKPIIEKKWNKLAKDKFLMTSISLRRYSGINSWILLYLSAKRLYNKDNNKIY